MVKDSDTVKFNLIVEDRYKIRAKRIALGMTTMELAKYSRIKEDVIIDIENGNNTNKDAIKYVMDRLVGKTACDHDYIRYNERRIIEETELLKYATDEGDIAYLKYHIEIHKLKIAMEKSNRYYNSIRESK